jgi:hypothetical protein
MRSISGPDISAFQQSYSAANGTPSLDTAAESDEAIDRAPAAAPHLEPYRPDMLPGATGHDLSPQDRLAAMRRERSVEPALPSRLSEASTRPNPLLRREGSLRESLLRKPLGTFNDRD